MAITWYELRDARLLSGLTQATLAKKLGVSQRSIGNYERPTGVIPTKAEYAIRSVLAQELGELERMRRENLYESSADSDIAGFMHLPQEQATYTRVPRLAGVSTIDMLRELLAREQEAGADESAGATITELRPDVGGLSDAQLAEYESAAGVDTTAPEEFDEESGDDRD